jgi:type I restriction enzyme S subunit
MVRAFEPPEGYQKTPVGVIPMDWKVHNIIENSTLKARIGWQGLTTAEYLEIGDYFLVTGTDFSNGRIKWGTCNYVSKERFLQDFNIQIKIDDILITKDGTIGKVAYINDLPKDGTLNSGVFVIRPKRNAYIPLFIFYIFNSFYFNDFLRKLVAGSTINHLYQKDFISFQFPLPPLREEQTAIATALSDTDVLIENLEKLIAKKRNIKQGALQKLLKPKTNWIAKKIGDVADVVGGGTPSTFNLKYWNGKINWFTPTEIGDKKYTYHSNRKITKEGLHNSSARLLPIGAILLTSRASIGDISILMAEGCTNQGFQSLITRRGFNNEFLYYLVLTLKPLLIQNASGSTFLEISPSKLEAIDINIPDYNMQCQIAEILSDMDTEILILEQKLHKYKMIKQGMMPILLTGKIRLV